MYLMSFRIASLLLIVVPHTHTMSLNPHFFDATARWLVISRGGLVLTALVYLLIQALPAFAANEQFYSQNPAPKTVEEVDQPMRAHFKKREKPGSLYDLAVREGRVNPFPSWLSNQHLHLKVRTFYLHQDHKDDSTSEAWAIGNWLEYDTGWLFNRVALGGSLYSSGKLYGPDTRDGTKLLLPGQKSFAVIGQAYGRIRVAPGHHVTLYRQKLDLPYLNTYDSRMAPITFEAYTLEGFFGKADGFPYLHYTGGYVAQIKERDANRFVNMAKAAGVNGHKRGLILAGMQSSLTKDVNFGIVNFAVPDTLNILYSEGNMIFRPTKKVSVTSQLQATYQSSLGEDLLSGRNFDTLQIAGELAGSYRNAIVRLAFATTSNDFEIQSPYGTPPSPLNLMLDDFDGAGEDAWLIGLSYNFEDWGLEELSGFVNFAQGFGAKNTPNREEIDVTLDYRFRQGFLHHWWIRVRNAFNNEINGNKTENQLRVILNYDLPIL